MRAWLNEWKQLWRDHPDYVVFVLTMAALSVLAIAVTGCAPVSSSSPPRIETWTAPDGATCYVIYDGDRVGGGNCVK